MKWREDVRRMKADGCSLTEIARKMRPAFPGLTDHQVWEKIRNVTRDRRRPDGKTKPVGVFSDTHIPFQHPGYLSFLRDTFRKYGVGRIVCCGDLVDFHAISRHAPETCAQSPCDELERALIGVREYTAAFPVADLILGNHDVRVIRQAATVNIDSRFLKSFAELFGLPSTWTVHESEMILDDVLYKHGINCGGKSGAINAAIQERMSVVMGHLHAFGGCQYVANARDLIFGLNVGCGIDAAQYAFAYGRHDKNRPTLGCGIVFDATSAIYVPMGKG